MTSLSVACSVGEVLSNFIVHNCMGAPNDAIRDTLKSIFDDFVPSFEKPCACPSSPKSAISVPSWSTVNVVSSQIEDDLSEEDTSDAAYFLRHAKTSHEMDLWQKRILGTAKRNKRGLSQMEDYLPFLAPVPPVVSALPNFNYTYDITNWQRPRKLIRIECPRSPKLNEEKIFKKPIPSPRRSPFSLYAEEGKPIVLKLNLKHLSLAHPEKTFSNQTLFTQHKLPESGKQEKVFSKHKKNFSRPRTPKSDDDESDLLQLQADCKLAQLQLKFIRLRKELDFFGAAR